MGIYIFPPAELDVWKFWRVKILIIRAVTINFIRLYQNTFPMMWNSIYCSCCSSMCTAFSCVTSLKARLNAGCSFRLYNCNACGVFTEHRIAYFETFIKCYIDFGWDYRYINKFARRCTFDKISAFLYWLKVLTLSPIGPQVIARTNYNQK